MPRKTQWGFWIRPLSCGPASSAVCPSPRGTDGRDHNRHGFSLWLAGGGFKRGYVHGATDDFGYAAVQDVVTIHDLHATLLHSLGLDHRALTYPHDGRDDSLSDEVVSGAKLVPELLEG